MAFEVVLEIRGLCAFVPRQPITLGSNAVQSIDAMKLLVLDARQSRVIPAGDRTEIDLNICAHLPLLRYPSANGPRDFWIFDGQRIELSNIEAGPLVIDPSFAGGTQMEKLVGTEQALVDPRFLDEVPPESIVASMELESGTVEAFDSTAFWEFLPPPVQNYPPDRFAGAARVTIPISRDRTTLRIFARNGSIVLERELSPKGNSKSLDLLLTNLCLEDEDRNVEADYAVFYDLLASYDGPFRVPHKSNGPNPPAAPGTANASPACVFSIMRSA